MCLEELFETVEARVGELGKRLLTDRATRVREEAEELEAALRYAYALLTGCRRRFTEARRRIASNEVKASLLASRVQTALLLGERRGAWRLALDLEPLHEALAADRANLPYLERACRNEQNQVALLERRLAPLQAKLRPA
jgi:hypothetical protein